MATTICRAKKPLDIRNTNFNPSLPASATNPVSLPVKPGDEVPVDSDFVDFHVAQGNVERIKQPDSPIKPPA